MKILLPALFALSLIATIVPAVAAPAKAPAKAPIAAKPVAKSVAPKVSVDSDARATFARAVALYHQAKALSIAWKRTNELGDVALASVAFDRAGRVRIAGASPLNALIVSDGENTWSLILADKNGVPRYTREHYSKEDAEFEATMQLELSYWISETLANLLDGKNPVSSEQVALKAAVYSALGHKLLEYRVAPVAPQSLDGELCDLVQVTVVYKRGAGNSVTATAQTTYWFAHSDGRLMRQKVREIWGKKYQAQNDDFQITAQIFNPQFAPDTFKWTPPKGAILAK